MDPRERRIRLIGVALVIGALNELTAAATGVWSYTPWYMTFVNWVLMFGVVMAAVAHRWFDRPLPVLYAIGTAIGLVYEIADEEFLHWAHLMDDRFLFMPSLVSSRILIAFLWGFVPVMCVLGLRLLNRAAGGAPLAGSEP